MVKEAKSDASCQIRSKVVGVVKQQLAFWTVRCHNTRAQMMTLIAALLMFDGVDNVASFTATTKVLNLDYVICHLSSA